VNKPRLPSALVIGPQKAGTTWIHHYFESRGDICLPGNVKETMFFDRRFDKGIAWYKKHFVPDGQIRCTIEVAPTYFHYPDVPKRVYETIGKIPIVSTLRDPAERSFSLYLHMRRYGMTRCTSFEEAVEKHPEIIGTSMYATHLKRWFAVFGQENVLVLLQEELKSHQTEYVQRLCEHLGLPFMLPGDELRKRVNMAALPKSPLLAAIGQATADGLRSAGLYSVINLAKGIGLKSLFFGHEGSDVPRITPKERAWVVNRLKLEIEELECMLGIDLSAWKAT